MRFLSPTRTKKSTDAEEKIFRASPRSSDFMPYINITMIQRRLFQGSRAILGRHGNLQSLPRSHFRPLQRIAPLAQQPLPKCYSTATETSSTGGAESQPPPDSPASKPTPEDALKQDLDAKSKEIIDLKASLTTAADLSMNIALTSLNRINTCAP